MTIEEICLFYAGEPPDSCEVRDIRTQDGDFRRAAFPVWGDAGRRIVIKLCDNAFSPPERISGWNSVMEEYRRIGVYCPRILPNRHGRLAESVEFEGHTCTVFAEEFARHRIAEDFPETEIRGEGGYCYREDALRTVGLMASRRLRLPEVTWRSGYTLFEKFSPDDPSDEAMECADLCRGLVEQHFPEWRERFDRIWAMYTDNRAQLEPLWRELPTSVFQADLNAGNILLDEEKRFAGLIDFNLSGCETSLVYIFFTARNFNDDIPKPADADQELFYNAELDRLSLASFLRNLALIGRFYRYTPEEKAAAPLLYRYMRPFWWEQYHALMKLKDASEAERQDKGERLLHWLERELTRTDIDFAGAMAGTSV